MLVLLKRIVELRCHAVDLCKRLLRDAVLLMLLRTRLASILESDRVVIDRHRQCRVRSTSRNVTAVSA